MSARPTRPDVDDVEWDALAALAIRQLALRGYVDVEAVLDLVGKPPHSQHVGAVFAAAQRSGLIEPFGARIGRHSRLVRVWHRAGEAT